jgi:hypothetical protein
MAFLGRTPLQVKCFKCKGEGILKFPCKDCFKGVCKNCKGKKRIGYRGLGGQYIVKNCITCKATGRCITCAATGIAKRGCHICTEKGSLFSARAVPLEYTKNLDYMINFLPKYAAGKNFLINAKMVGLAKTDQLKIEKEEAAKMAAKRRAEELEFYQAERKAAQKKREAKAYKGTTSVAGVSKRDANLGHVLLEFNQFFRNRERISKQSVYEVALAEYKDNKPTLLISVTASVGRVNKDLKMQYLEAFYNFWKLRCSSNGLRGSIGMTVNYKKNVIASVESGEVKLK